MLRILQSYFATEKAILFSIYICPPEKKTKQEIKVKFVKICTSKSLLIQFEIAFEECQKQNSNMVL